MNLLADHPFARRTDQSHILAVEYPLAVRRGKIGRPADHVLVTKGQMIGSQPSNNVPALTFKCALEEAVEVYRWADQVMHPAERCRLFGCWQITVYDVRIERTFLGVTAYCIAIPDAFQFKLSWCDFWQGAF